MKKLACIFLSSVLFYGCKKPSDYDSCFRVSCGTNAHCENGVCVCDSGYAGVDCSINIFCQYAHTGSVTIFSNSPLYGHNIYINNIKTSLAIAPGDTVTIDGIASGVTNFAFVSNESCWSSNHYVPCSLISKKDTIRDCENTFFTIP
jgi:hypothetical protein